MVDFTSAVITGGGSGLGRAIALRLATAGSSLLLVDMDPAGLSATETLASSQGCRVTTVCGDVAAESTWTEVLHCIAEHHLSIDLLANCAGVAASGNVEEVALETWQWVMNANFFGTVQACRAIIPLLKQQKAGCILNVASRAAISSVPQMGPYSASKAALVSLSETLYSELRSLGISITVACPSYFQSALAERMRAVDAGQRQVAHRLIEHSTTTADAMAEQVLMAVSHKQLYYFPPGEDRMLWRLKRLLPRFCLNLVNKKYLQAIAQTEP